MKYMALSFYSVHYKALNLKRLCIMRKEVALTHFNVLCKHFLVDVE